MPIRLKDIAEILNLSVSTVSAVFQNREDISPATRERVLAKARELNYRPNLLARGLVTQKTFILGVVIPDLSRAFFAEVTKGIDQVAAAAGYSLLLSNTEEDPAREDRILATLVSQRVDGLIIASARAPRSRGAWQKLTDQCIPFVLVDRRFAKTHFVGADDEMIGYLATEHLLEQGYRRIAHICGPRGIATAAGRQKGYLKAMQRFQMEYRPEYLVEANYHEESSGFAAMQHLLRQPVRPDAVFAASDPIAIGALDAILQAGLNVPEQVGVIGVGNHRYGPYLRVPLSTVDQHRVEIGQVAGRLLLELIARRAGPPKPVLLKPEVILRASSLKVPAAGKAVLVRS